MTVPKQPILELLCWFLTKFLINLCRTTRATPPLNPRLRTLAKAQIGLGCYGCAPGCDKGGWTSLTPTNSPSGVNVKALFIVKMSLFQITASNL